MLRRSDNKESVLITSGNYAIIRSFGKNGIRTVVASEHDDTPVKSSRFCDEVVRIPAPSDGLVSYKDALVGIAARPDVEVIVPARPEDAYIFSKYYDEFDAYARLVAQPFDMLQSVHDRRRLFDAAQAAGVPMARTRLLSEVGEFEVPSIVKPRFNILTGDYVEGFGPEDYDIIKRVVHVGPGDDVDQSEILAEMKHDPIVQDYVPPADKYMFGAIYDHGEAVATFQHRQIRGDSYTGGGGVYRRSVYIPELEAVGRALLDHLQWHGLACIEYLQDAETGEFKIIELNPRLWQSVPSAMRSGADFPYYYWLVATGQKHLVTPGYNLGTGTHYLWGELNHLRSVVSDDSPLVERPALSKVLWEVASSIALEPRFDYLHLDDPGPFLHFLVHVAFLRHPEDRRAGEVGHPPDEHRLSQRVPT
ncbi:MULTISPECIES: carboxylate--amine ligase [Haloferax]|uniref:carboxylate--amine ligase n=1 Tax=Haloferax TaxID=2251 RepID=UPI001786AC15|nr:MULTISPECIES: carboxylate--amine ligase [Haloferax]